MFAKKTANLIDQPDTVRNQAASNPMNSLYCQLFGGFDGHEAHAWTSDRFADGFGVVPIVLVRFHIRGDKLGFISRTS